MSHGLKSLDNSEGLAGVAERPQANEINECDGSGAAESPAELAGNPSECRTLGTAEVVRRLTYVSRMKPGEEWPDFLDGENGWGPPLSALCGRAAELLGAEPPAEPPPSRNHHETIRQIRADRGQFDVHGMAIEMKLGDALHKAGSSALGMPGTVDTFQAWLTDAGLKLVLA